MGKLSVSGALGLPYWAGGGGLHNAAGAKEGNLGERMPRSIHDEAQAWGAEERMSGTLFHQAVLEDWGAVHHHRHYHAFVFPWSPCFFPVCGFFIAELMWRIQDSEKKTWGVCFVLESPTTAIMIQVPGNEDLQDVQYPDHEVLASYAGQNVAVVDMCYELFFSLRLRIGALDEE